MKRVILLWLISCVFTIAHGQELSAKVTINHQQIQGTSNAVFDQLKTAITDLLNTRQWTTLQYSPKERINCNFALTISKYDAASGQMSASLQVQSTRPIYNATLTTPILAYKDANFDFSFREFEPIEFREEDINNALTAMLAYYAYMIIGLDMDAMALKGGTAILQRAQNLVNQAQQLGGKGWSVADGSNSRYGLVNEYLDGGMEPLRTMVYSYHRQGLDIMATNPDRGRASIFSACTLLSVARQNKPLSRWPQLITEIKGEEIANIFTNKGNTKDREEIKRIMQDINPSLSNTWNKIK